VTIQRPDAGTASADRSLGSAASSPPNAGPDPALEITIDTRVHGLLAVKKAAYRLARRCTVVLGSPEGDLIPLRFLFPRGTGEETAAEAVRLFHRELLDEDLRAVIHDQTDALRDLILAHTFSRMDLVERRDPNE